MARSGDRPQRYQKTIVNRQSKIVNLMTEPIIITDPDSDRYHTFSYISWWQQEVVREATVMVVGAGALGNEVIKNLALMGIGNLLICDFDTIEDSNLSRSVLFRESDNGKRKVDAAAKAAKELNPDVNVKAWHGDINAEMGLGVFRHVDVIVGCLDNREARLSIDRFSQFINRPWVDGAIQELMGIVRVFWPGRGANYESTLTDYDYQMISLRYSCPILARENVLQGKVPTTPTSASIVAAFQTQEALKLIHKMEVEPGVAMLINGLTNDIYKTEYPVIEDRLHPPLEPLIELPNVNTNSTTVNELLAIAKDKLGEETVLEFSYELVVSMVDPTTQEEEFFFKRMGKLSEASLNATSNGVQREMRLTHRITGEEDFLDRTLAEIDVAPLDIIQARNGKETAYLEMTGDLDTFFQFD
ncbi:MAG: ThiF family adenylyltransferase [Chloroflexi bacterium]|nr:MAG: ThiF family adenylyltransferase [Chloroflexota bacterium]